MALCFALERRGSGGLLTIADSGCGLPPAEADAVEGLGMHLVRLMVAQVGGELTIHRSPGARFEITLPEGSLT
ncbi:MAG TPA: ATP-binding protein [Caulobacteraceae bacterium]|jgi:two-component sensor histidine kinase